MNPYITRDSSSPEQPGSIFFSCRVYLIRAAKIVALLLTASSCASPNLTDFATASQSMVTISNNINSEVEKELNVYITNVVDGNDRNRLNQQLEATVAELKKVTEAMQIVVAYSNALGRITTSGDSGESAAEQIIASVNGLGASVSEENGNLISRFVSKVQSAAIGNPALHELMSVTQPTIQEIQQQTFEFGEAGKSHLADFFSLLEEFPPDQLDVIHGRYRIVSGKIETLNESIEVLNDKFIESCANFENAKEPCRCKNGESCTVDAFESELSERFGELEDLKLIFENRQSAYQGGHFEYVEFIKSIKRTEVTINRYFDSLVEAVRIWNNHHSSTIGYLRDCKNLRGVFKPKCRALSAENLQLGTEILQKFGFVVL